jgi:Protein of unknown function (DUF3039)
VTLRCLSEDLTTGWNTPRAQRAAQSLSDLLARHVRGSASDADIGAFLRVAPSLDQLDHPLIRSFAETPDLIETLSPSSVRTPAGRVAGFSAGEWRGTVLLRVDADSGPHAVAWLVAARRVDGGAAGAESVDSAARLPQSDDLLLARIECAAEHREEWKADVHRATRRLFARALETGDAGPVPIAGPAGNAPLFDLTLSLERADADEPAQAIVVLTPLQPGAEAAVRVGTRTVLAAISGEALAWTAAPLAAGAMSYAAPLRDCVHPGSSPAGAPGRMRVGTFAHYAPTAGLTEATMAGTPVQALCGHWFVPMHDHASRPTCERCAALRDTLT